MRLRPHRVALGALAALHLFAPREAAAQPLSHRVRVRVEAGGAAMLSSSQRDTLGYSLGAWFAARAGLRVAGGLGVELAVANGVFPRDGSTGGVVLPTAGLSFTAPLDARVRAVFEAGLGPGVSGDRVRLGASLGAGFELVTAPGWTLGASLRYGWLRASPGASVDGNAIELDASAHWLSLALTAGWGPRRPVAPSAPPAAPPRDGDRDGLIDRDDRCPDLAAGPQPDPTRPGCPRRDRDGDGLWDDLDRCPDVPVGDRPDTTNAGCPRPRHDRDGDDVDDDDDRCPDEAQGETPDAARRGCPDADDDNDRIRNGLDQCPAQHSGYHPDLTRLGCPLPDDDRDAVPDALDRCLRDAGAPSTNAQRNGCPGLVRIVGDRIEILRPVYFATARAELERRSAAVLDAVADAMRATPLIARLRVEGHTDDQNDDASNLDLSQRRADAVRAWLLAHGVEADRVEAHGYGETRPAVTPAPTLSRRALRDARAANRRVVFNILQLRDADGTTRPPPNAGPAAPTVTAADTPARPARRRHRR